MALTFIFSFSLQIIDATIEEGLKSIKIPSRWDHLKSRTGSIRVLGLKSSRYLKRPRMYSRSFGGRNGIVYSRGFNLRNAAGGNRGFNYKRRLTIRSLGDETGQVKDGQENKLRITANRLSISHLSREFNDEQLTCLSTNNNVTAPTSSHVTVVMNCKCT